MTQKKTSKNTTIPDEDLRAIFEKKLKLGGRGQYITNCPFCGKDHHFYINRTSQLWDCKKCGEEGNIVKLLSFLGKLFLLGDFKSIDRTKLKSLSEFNSEDPEDELQLSPETRKLPFGFKRIFEDDYLGSRGFSKKDLEKHKFGYTSLKPRLKDYIIVGIEEDGEIKGYLARLNWSKDRIIKFEKRTGRKKARYLNDKGAKFSNLLFGFDEINENTDTVILLEGFTDKITLDNVLGLGEIDDIKCCATFGKKISKTQILKLLKKGVKNIILIFDSDAIKEMKKHGKILSDFFNVNITYTYNKDINDSTEEEIMSIFGRMNDVHSFNRRFVKVI